jgi:hypothetical protein
MLKLEEIKQSICDIFGTVINSILLHKCLKNVLPN